MAGSPGSGASMEGISLGFFEEADLRREGRKGSVGRLEGKLTLQGLGYLERLP